ncbi:MAG: hypothetical protein V3V41_06835, partial [Candidatus Heimdallarchaeota archaeon]
KTEGCVYLDYRDNCLQIPSSKNEEELNELIRVGFTNAILRGPLKSLPIRKITLIIEDIEELSANSLRYEIVVPLVRNTVHEAMLNSNIGIFEPIYTFSINTPIHYLGPILAVMQKFGCEIENTEHLVTRSIITGEISVESSLQIASELRSASEGYAFWQFNFQGYKRKKSQ